MFLHNKTVLIIFISAICIGFDQISKYAAKSLIKPGTIISLLGDTIRLQLAKNEGAFLSMGSSFSHEFRFLVFTILVSVMLFLLLIYYFSSKSLSALSYLSLALIISGGFSNLIDRIIHKGVVIDFLNFGIGNLRTGILNIADMAITFGVILLIYSFIVKTEL
ncbi:MAG: signal peptidase II [Candidatus Caldatribacteriota bacterium]|jgi:signal peptidase II|nr:signal peptidase II [Atribacterota bacterium]MDD3031015.1 signal peptidase II [Atribacterota bacterium]MDD3640762.1 signal peptidase II [Atribacterota bacterium]MDD4289539.1 signal peptidase II [Atribacterota bacterium]MDD4765196.1 signal peptidase II [Atribacterota bacterium]